jgi:hypothetical protein
MWFGHPLLPQKWASPNELNLQCHILSVPKALQPGGTRTTVLYGEVLTIDETENGTYTMLL